MPRRPLRAGSLGPALASASAWSTAARMVGRKEAVETSGRGGSGVEWQAEKSIAARIGGTRRIAALIISRGLAATIVRGSAVRQRRAARGCRDRRDYA